MELAVCFSGGSCFTRSERSQPAPSAASFAGGQFTAGDEGSGLASETQQECDLPHAAPFFRHASARGRLRHAHVAGLAWPPRRDYDADLYPRHAEAWTWREKSGGFDLNVSACAETFLAPKSFRKLRPWLGFKDA